MESFNRMDKLESSRAEAVSFMIAPPSPIARRLAFHPPLPRVHPIESSHGSCTRAVAATAMKALVMKARSGS